MKKRKKGGNERIEKTVDYSASSNFKEVDIPKSMLLKDFCSSSFLKFSFAFMCSEFRGNKHNLVFFFEFTFVLIKRKSI